LRATFVVRLHLIFAARLKFSATKEFVTVRAYLYVDNAHTPTLVLARVHALLSQVRRR
jgi:hypothetical protein